MPKVNQITPKGVAVVERLERAKYLLDLVRSESEEGSPLVELTEKLIDAVEILALRDGPCFELVDA